MFTANAWGLPESTIEPAAAHTPDAADRTYTAVYDAAGQLSELRRPGGITVANSYDPLGNLTRQVGAGASVVTPDREFGYDAARRLITVSAPCGTNTYGDNGRATWSPPPAPPVIRASPMTTTADRPAPPRPRERRPAPTTA